MEDIGVIFRTSLVRMWAELQCCADNGNKMGSDCVSLAFFVTGASYTQAGKIGKFL